MFKNESLRNAKIAKNDEFYTLYGDIEAEINAYVEYDKDVFRGKTVLLPCDDPEWSNFTKYFVSNFERFGIKKLISTCYARSPRSKQSIVSGQSLFFSDKGRYDFCGKVFTLTRITDSCSEGSDSHALEFSGYLNGDGDFRSDEVTRLRDEADIIITNPPFSLLSELICWIMKANKKFIIVGNINATYKEIFPYLRDNKIWLGYTPLNKTMYFDVPDDYKRWLCDNRKEGLSYRIISGTVMRRLSLACWFTNIDHGIRYKPLILETMEHNLRYNNRLRESLKKKYGAVRYPHYDNYDAIEVPFVDCIPLDYEGVMGVPITFLGKYNPYQFEILGISASWCDLDGIRNENVTKEQSHNPIIGGRDIYKRLFIRKRCGYKYQFNAKDYTSYTYNQGLGRDLVG